MPITPPLAAQRVHDWLRWADDPNKFLWLAGSLFLTTIVCVMLFQWFVWRRWSRSLAPTRSIRNAVAVDFHESPTSGKRLSRSQARGMLPEGEEEEDASEIVAWQQRALKAEQRARRVATLAQSGMKPHLLGLMREKLVFWLSSQRSHLLDSHETGTAQVVELEERLERIQSQFQERLVARERRISDLEKELSNRHSAGPVPDPSRENSRGPLPASNE